MKTLKEKIWEYTSTDKVPEEMSMEEIIQFGISVWGNQFAVTAARLLAKEFDKKPRK